MSSENKSSLKEAKEDNFPQSEKAFLVGIGASAGGLEALQAFITNLPDETPFTFIIAQHLSPTHASLLRELIERHTTRHVLTATDKCIPQKDHVYICPPNKNITIQSGVIYLSEPSSEIYNVKPSIDLFFDSLSESEKEKAIGIILSGTGTDGARGIRFIKAAGGITCVQQPETAKYDGMPNAALMDENVDLILPPELMGHELLEIYKLRLENPNLLTDDVVTQETLDLIIRKLSLKKRVDFTRYKINTIQRRVERRMAANKIKDIKNYNTLLENNIRELDALYNDVLINVTSFFRDPESYDVLQEYFREYTQKRSSEQIRIWVPGCSSGEEPISIAIMISEILGNQINKYKIQIFATDIDEQAIKTARDALYPYSAMACIPPEIREKYFVAHNNNQYRPISTIREMCIYSLHDVIKDPPFLRMDLISCRNMLIYFTGTLQNEILKSFHYSLNKEGILILGRSETVSNTPGVSFKTLDSAHKIYSTGSIPKNSLPPKMGRYYTYEEPSTTKGKTTRQQIHDLIIEQINTYIIPSCVVINELLDLVYVKGKNPYIVAPQGERNDNIYQNIHHDLNLEMHTLLHILSKEEKIQKTDYTKVELYGGIIRYVRMIAIRMESNLWNNMVLICFQEESELFFNTHFGQIENVNADEQLKAELESTKEHMQALLEEMESTNEEMQSLNEELQSSNEELQSSNEELETTNEELQSTNEELHTAYSELQDAYDEKRKEVDEHRNTRSLLEESTQRLELALVASNLGEYEHHIPIRDDDVWSERFAKIFGYSFGDLPKDSKFMREWIMERIHPEDIEQYKTDFERFVRAEDVFLSNVFRIFNKAGEVRWIKHQARALKRDGDGRVLQMIGTLGDITQEKELAEQRETIIRQETRLALLVQETRVGIWEWDVRHNMVSLSSYICEQFDIAKKGLPYTLDQFLRYFNESDTLKLQIHAIAKQEKETLRIRTSSTASYEKWFLQTCQAEITDNKVTKVIGYLFDITQEVKREEMLDQMSTHIGLIQELSQTGIFELDMDTQTYWRSRQYCEVLGLDTASSVVGKFNHFLALMPSDDQKRYQETVENAISKRQPYEISYSLTTPKGKAYLITEKGRVEKTPDSKSLIQGIISVSDKT